ncbi:type VII secretion-associated serine protease mycosin [Streptomyces sp. NPDC005438]|uniref:type VII secretion-associated serine protease mycosin n=1 Tax=Streptomyces sp. NPDC005438 TaxID=3156880 RepID=UPI0033BD7894
MLTLLVLPGGAHAAPTDAVRDQQWALRMLNATEAWRTTKGKGITVAVLDTGVDGDHPDLRGSVLKGRDLVGLGAQRGSDSWARHGTAMAGTIAGHGHGKGRKEGLLGIAPQARVLPVRVLLEDDDPSRPQARRKHRNTVAEGIRWAADHGADVINLSLGDDSGGARPAPAEDAAVRYALGKGVSVVASAGNGGNKGDHTSYPAAYPGVIAVAAVDRRSARASFSTRRWYTTVSAPGKDVAIPRAGGGYFEGWGTSLAAAYTSGVVALVRAAHPDLSPAQVKKLLADTARRTPAGGRSDSLGTGVVDPSAAIELGSQVKPQPQKPSSPRYEKEHFGPGPRRDESFWPAVWTGALGVALIVGAVALHRGVGNLPGLRTRLPRTVPVRETRW